MYYTRTVLVTVALACFIPAGLVLAVGASQERAHAQRMARVTVVLAADAPTHAIDLVDDELDQGPCCDDEPDRGKLESLVLARMYRSEHGFPRRYRTPAGGRGWDLGDDMEAIDAVLQRVERALEAARLRRVERGAPRPGDDIQVDYVRAAFEYTRGRAFDRERTDANCDIPWLALDADEEPGRWCAGRTHGVPFANRREAWRVVVRHAVDVHTAARPSRCVRPPLHWGCGPATSTPPRGTGLCRDHERAARAGWVELDCGNTINTFYEEPR